MDKPIEELLSEMKAAAEKANTDAEHNDWGYDTDAFHDVATPDNVLALIAALEQAPLTVKLPGRGGVENSTIQSIKDWSDGWAAYREEAIKAIHAAGGSVEGSE